MGEFDRLAKCVGFPPTGQNMDLNSHSSIENWKFIRDNNVIEAYKIQQYFVILRMSVILV
jgi:hypothetical protein